MHCLDIIIFFIYFLVLLSIIFFSYHRQKSDSDFVIGNRSLNFWLTALSAHASDMSSWLFLAYPALIFTNGIFYCWAAIGLIVFMYINWQFIAPKIRNFTGQCHNLTLNAYFESRFNDNSKIIRTISSLMTLLFYIFYISAGLVSLGYLVETLFGLNYFFGIIIGLAIVAFYVFLGGYTTVAWIDLFQGFFLLFVILFIPIILLYQLDGFPVVIQALKSKGVTTSLFPDFSKKTILQLLLLACGWGLGYFGQPHIITKFMGIKHVSEMHKAKYLGISWQMLTLFGATLFGLIGVVLFPNGIANQELITLNIVHTYLPAFIGGLVLCAILAATTNVIAAQILVVASSVAEDLYKRLFNKNASHKKILFVSRTGVIGAAIVSFIIAFFKPSSIYHLVLYSWSGLGASFGPLLLISLHYKKTTKPAAISGILTGGLTAAIWPLIFGMEIIPLIPAFILSTICILIISFLSKKKQTNYL